MRGIYTLLYCLALPVVLAKFAWRGRTNRAYLERFAERFGCGARVDSEGPVVWIHAVSVGEVQAALPLVRALLSGFPGVHIVLTTMTPTGAERVRQALGEDVEHRYAPYDLPGSVRRFLDRVHPNLVVIMETELWPNTLHQCARRAVPVVLANARLSARSARRYARLGQLARRMLERVSAFAVQSRDDADRLIALGARRDRVRVTGSVKFDVRLAASVSEEAQVIRRCWGVDRGVCIAASTHQGEEEQVLDAFEGVRAALPNSLLVLVPRHPDRAASVAALCRRRGLRTVLRSSAPASCLDAQVYVGDTMGELPLFYAAADVAFVGGTLAKIGGHNALEPAALGVPVVLGPHVFNFAEISRRLCEQGAARQVDDAEELGRVLLHYLRDANLRHNAGERGRRFVKANRGALDGLVDIISPLLA